MKKVIYSFIFGVCMMCTPKIYAGYARVDFKVVNTFGDTIPYLFTDGEEGMVTVSSMDNEEWYKTDSLVIPEKVTYQGHEYVVSKAASWAFATSPSHVKSIVLPKSYSGVDMATDLVGRFFGVSNPFFNSAFEKIIVEKDNPNYKSEDGVLYSKDGNIIVAFPREKKVENVELGEGISELGDGVFCGNPYVKSVILPNTLKIVPSASFLDLSSLEELILKDSVETVQVASFGGAVPRIVLGKGVKNVSEDFVISPYNSFDLLCYAQEPPEITSSNLHTNLFNVYGDSITLFVPRKSLDAYRQADGWKNCASILPIEPPIVVGADETTVSWVQNFSATGYVWTLYGDDSHTDMVMSLTFSEKGYLTDIVLGSLAPNRTFEANAPMMRISAADGDDTGDSERRFAEYYSFTIKSLTPNTKYYYTRQTLAGDEVIDEEQGSFATLPDTGTGMEQHPSLEVPDAGSKFIRDGQLQIRCQDKTYTVQGVETK